MRIGELAARTGVTVRALRYYEELQILRPHRGPGGQRRYRAADVDRVVLVQELYAAGLHSRRIAELVPALERSGADPSRPVAALLDERSRILREIRDRHRALSVLDEIVARVTGADRDESMHTDGTRMVR
ncbi:DNA-binding transcriptional MerR regulator [Nocardioides thalensis]|uniref:DNA-binding transcriptional MerR regulator n=1 Tax=Nocardioides thalensis TaxID=1914755 RepID=A0A853BXR4_9ACTN|nr:DNA-binding transcriptional MerR regulator [Nocardioides thalensis]